MSNIATKSQNIQSVREDLAAAFRWAVKYNWHESVANHFSCATNAEGTQFLINPNQRHFSRISASDLLLLDANDNKTLDKPNAPDATAWGLHGSIHRRCPHAKCVMHVHSTFATVLACLENPELPPIDQNTAMFYQRYVVDSDFSGLALESEGERCAAMLSDPKIKVMIMGNHGVLVIGDSVANAFNNLYYFERAAETYVRALQTGKKLKALSHEIASNFAQSLEDYYVDYQHFNELRAILNDEESDYRS